MTVEISTNNLDAEIERYIKELGYRLDMIVPADAPREALVSKDGESLLLVSEPPVETGGLPSTQGDRSGGERSSSSSRASANPPVTTGGSDFVRGRAGMEYRDLIPGRLGGKVIASHIRLTSGGEVPDYVHYHKVDFQMIYCKRGRIRVVYEDQGPPFWLETGDCVLQPPEIRHRVLKCTAGAEVIEVSMPAEHETWVEHEMELPNSNVDPRREFRDQRFLRFQESLSEPFVGSGYVQHVVDVSNRKVSITIESFVDRDNNSRTRGWFVGSSYSEFVYVLQGEIEMQASGSLPSSFKQGRRFNADDCFVLPRSTAFTFDWTADLKLLAIKIHD